MHMQNLNNKTNEWIIKKKKEVFCFDDFQGDISFRSQLNKYLKRVSYVFYMNLAGV